MDVYIQSEIGPCENYTDDKGEQKEISVVISPLKVITEESQIRVINGCSMWMGCKNSSCFFSRAGRQAPKVKSKI